jgi:hypothetical protein
MPMAPVGEAQPLEGGAVGAQRHLVLGTAVEEVEHDPRQAPARERAQIVYVRDAGEIHGPRVYRGRAAYI